MKAIDGRAGTWPLHEDEDPILTEEPEPYVQRGQYIAARLLEDVEVDVEGGTLLGQAGDYILQTPQGSVHIVSEQGLRAGYMRTLV